MPVPPFPIHFINLTRSTDRFETFRTRNAHLVGALRQPAVDGSALDRQELVRTGIILDDCPYGPGTLGCALSHIELWRRAQTENLPLTVLEDDVLAAHHFEKRMLQLGDELPEDWDIVFWGYAYNHNCHVWVDIDVAKVNLQFYDNRIQTGSEFQSRDGSYALLRLLNSFGLVAYSISPKGASIMLKACLPLRKRDISFAKPGIAFADEGIDGPMNLAYPMMQAFICFPPLVIQDETYGSIRAAMDRG